MVGGPEWAAAVVAPLIFGVLIVGIVGGVLLTVATWAFF